MAAAWTAILVGVVVPVEAAEKKFHAANVKN
jgi:hypothetical protein